MQCWAVHESAPQSAVRVFGHDSCHVQPGSASQFAWVSSRSPHATTESPPGTPCAVPTQTEGTHKLPGCTSEHGPAGGCGYGIVESLTHAMGHAAPPGSMPTVMAVRLAIYTVSCFCAATSERDSNNYHSQPSARGHAERRVAVDADRTGGSSFRRQRK